MYIFPVICRFRIVSFLLQLLSQRLQRSRASVFVLVEKYDGQPLNLRAIGGGQLRAGIAPWDGPEIQFEAVGTAPCVLYSLVVAAEHQGRGIGSLIL
jgi:hypothetical protein